MSGDLEKIVSRLESVASRLETLPQLSNSGDMKPANSNTKCSVVSEYEQIINGFLHNFLQLSEKIGGDVKTHAAMVGKAFNAHLEFLRKASTSSKPSAADLQSLLKPTADAINCITSFREANRRSEFFNHLSAVSEGIPVLGWVGVSPTPCPFIKEMQDASQFYTNRVIKDFKEKNPIHVDWTKVWIAVFVELQSFVKKHYTTGLVWGGHGSAVTAGAPPPPPPAPIAAPPPSTDGGSANAHLALFSEINKGTEVTSGLKKVTDDMKTHKNPNLRSGSTVPASTKTGAVCAKPAQGGKQCSAKPPQQKLEGTKWTVEHFNNKNDIVLADTSIKQTLYAFKCDNCVITVKGKINSIVLDSCSKTAIVFDGLISGLDIVNCKSVQAQTLGVVPIVNIDKTDGAQIYLSKESLGTEIVSAKSSEMNVLVPKPDGEMTEMPLPEQFKTRIVNGKLVTTCAEDF